MRFRAPALAAALAVWLAFGVTSASAGPRAFVRLNQIGWTPTAQKHAFLMTPSRAAGARFRVVTASGRTVLRGRARARTGSWSRAFRFVYALDLSRLSVPGLYRVALDSPRATSPAFRIAPAAALYGRLASDAVSFLNGQRDTAHTSDSSATAYAMPASESLLAQGRLTPVGERYDASGGWYDAGDYLKFVQTASFTDTLLLVAQRDSAGPPPALSAEARWGLDWLLRMWDQQSGTLYVQVGRGDGTQRVLGDHDLWRLPARDERLPGGARSRYRFIRNRPLFRAGSPGAPISPNLAGRLAAVFGLCAQVYRSSDPALASRCLSAGEAVYAQADTQVKHLITAAPYEYYAELEWRDDMELGATELGLALLDGAPHAAGLPVTDPDTYLRDASGWAHAYSGGHDADLDSLNLLDVSALAHSELFEALARAAAAGIDTSRYPDRQPELVSDVGDQLVIASRRSSLDPFRFGSPNGWADSTSHALGIALTARLYAHMTGQPAFDRLGSAQIDWFLGANGWGTTFMTGAGSTFPRCLQHQVANLSYSLSGRGRVLRGAVVNGPNTPDNFAESGAPDGHRACSRNTAFARFDGRGGRYRDSVKTAASSEPTDDAAALAVALFTRAAG